MRSEIDRRLAVLALVVAVNAGCATLTPLPGPRNQVPPLAVTGVRRVALIILENGNPELAANQPFMKLLASKGTVLTRYFAVAHPSQPNYVAMISGSTAGAMTDNPITLHRPHIGQTLGSRWRVYAEGYPALAGKCNLVKQDGIKPNTYVRRHVPFLSFADVQTGDCSQIVRLDGPGRPLAALEDDIKAGTLPDFAMIIPNLLHDGHEPATLDDANAWLMANIKPLLENPAFTDGLVLVLTFDEDDSKLAKRNRVFTVVWGDQVKNGTSNDVYDHEDLLATIAALLHVSPPPLDEPGARAIGGIWK